MYVRGGGAGQSVRGPTLTMKFEKWRLNDEKM